MLCCTYSCTDLWLWPVTSTFDPQRAVVTWSLLTVECYTVVMLLTFIRIIISIPSPLKTEWWGAGVVICLERGADLHMAQLMPLLLTVSFFSKIQIGLPFWYRLTQVVPEKEPLNGCVCVCVYVNILWTMPARLVLLSLQLPASTPVWARGRCRISPPRFLAECCKRQLNQASYVFAVF